MGELNLLGVSKSAAAVIFDLAFEVLKVDKFYMYSNIEAMYKTLLPVKEYDIEVKSLEHISEACDNVFFATPGPSNKALVFKDFFNSKLINKNRFVNIIHPSSYCASSTELNKGILIEPMSVISSQTIIEFGVFIKRGVSIGHHNHIGAFTDLNPGVTTSGNVRIGTGCEIGTGAVIRDGITIGNNTVIGMGSVVTKDIPANCVAYGNPCKVVKSNLKNEIEELLLELEAKKYD